MYPGSSKTVEKVTGLPLIGTIVLKVQTRSRHCFTRVFSLQRPLANTLDLHGNLFIGTTLLQSCPVLEQEPIFSNRGKTSWRLRAEHPWGREDATAKCSCTGVAVDWSSHADIIKEVQQVAGGGVVGAATVFRVRIVHCPVHPLPKGEGAKGPHHVWDAYRATAAALHRTNGLFSWFWVGL